MARLRLHQHKFAQARAYADTAIRLREKSRPTDFLHLAEYYQTLGLVNTGSKEFGAAATAFTRAITLFEQANVVNSFEYIDARAEYAAVLRHLGKKDEAKRIEHECKNRREKIETANHLQYTVDVTTLKRAPK